MSIFNKCYPVSILILLVSCANPLSDSPETRNKDDHSGGISQNEASGHKTTIDDQKPQNDHHVEPGSVVINEFMTIQNRVLADPDFDQYSGWIELRNTKTHEISVSGWIISGSALEGEPYAIPAGTSITAGDFLLLWADGADTSQDALHTSFTLSTQGGVIELYGPVDNGMPLVDDIQYQPSDVHEDISIGRLSFGKQHPGFVLPLADPTPGFGNRLPPLRRLRDYTLDIAGPSGIAADPDGEHLWIVSDNREGRIYKTTLEGAIVKRLNVDGHDMEGIAFHPEYGTLWVVEEQKREIIEYDTDGNLLSRIFVDIPVQNPNDGLEGITINPVNNHIFVVNEKNPRLLVELDESGKERARISVDFGLDELVDGLDLSGLNYDHVNKWLWVVSDEAEAIIAMDRNGRPLAAYQTNIPDMEGIVVLHDRGEIAVVSDDLERLVFFELPKPIRHLPLTTATSTSVSF